MQINTAQQTKQRPYYSQWEKRTFMRLKLLHTQQGTKKKPGKENKSKKHSKEKPPPTDEALQEQ